MTTDASAPAGRPLTQGPEQTVAYADAASRLVAYLIDGVIVGVVIFAVAFVLSRVLGSTLPAADANGVRASVDQGRALINALVATAISGAYFVGCWLVLGGTLGQRLLGIAVQSEADGGRLRPGQALVRWVLLGAWWGLLGALLLSISLAAWVLAAAFIVWDLVLIWTTARDERKQGLHDRLAGSVVHRRVRLVPSAS